MGTRSVTHVYDESGDLIISLYRQYDGYLSGMGKDLKDFLDDIVIVNGMSLNDPRRIANGMPCLAAQMVAHFKTEPGGFYLYPPDNDLDAGQDYTYRIKYSEKLAGLKISVSGWDGQIYSGPLAEFDPLKLEAEE